MSELVEAIRDDIRRLPTLTATAIRSVSRKHAQAIRASAPATIVADARALLHAGGFAHRVIAYEMLGKRRDAIHLLNGPSVDQLGKDLADWASIDLFGVTVAGIAWREGMIDDAHVMRWVRSKDRWQRRLALVATVPLNIRARGGEGDPKRTLMVCEALLDDRDDMVVKALSWSLRELAKRDRRAVQRFLKDNTSRLAPRVTREVRNKLDTGKKNP